MNQPVPIKWEDTAKTAEKQLSLLSAYFFVALLTASGVTSCFIIRLALNNEKHVHRPTDRIVFQKAGVSVDITHIVHGNKFYTLMRTMATTEK